MENVTEALSFAVSYLNLSKEHPATRENTLIIAAYHPLYSQLFPKSFFTTHWAGSFTSWVKAGHQPFSLSPTEGRKFSLILVEAPQQTAEIDFLLAQALCHADENGIILVAADNQTGGKTLEKRLAAFGCPTGSLSKHKCRVTWTMAPQQALQSALKQALAKGDVQIRESDSMASQPGIFSWDRRDKGTEIFLKYLPHTLSGSGADLGCGLGEIGKFILENCAGISRLTALDHDQRAIECCRQNLKAFDKKTEFLWQDLPAAPPLDGLDFVVMNPPFHIGKKESHDLGKLFLKKAHQALKPGGKLYLVANSHLPYEQDLKSLFSHLEILAVENGFKVIAATK